MQFTSRGTLETRSRLIVLTDMENEPDDSQTLVRLLMYANEVDIEGLIAVTSRWTPVAMFPESIEDRVRAYGVVRPNLQKHAVGWPSAETLLSRIASGQPGFGMTGVGDGRNSSGSELIVRALTSEDARPLWVAINAGANTLAQALWDLRRDATPDVLVTALQKLRVYDDSGQDDAGAWICHEFPDLAYYRSQVQVFGLFGPSLDSGPQPWAPLDQHAWAEKNIRTRHGVLGALYPQRWVTDAENRIHFSFMEGGGTTTWLGLVNKGLWDPAHPHWGGWGGRFERTRRMVPAGQWGVADLEAPYLPFEMYPEASDHSFSVGAGEDWNTFSGVIGDTPFGGEIFAPLWRWRDAYTHDFQARMDWCVTDYEQANHPPVAVFDGDAHRTVVRITARPGETLELDASGSSDPDAGMGTTPWGRNGFPEPLDFSWAVYPEAGTVDAPPIVEQADAPIAGLTAPADAAGAQLHVILSVRNRSSETPLTSYRRVVIDIEDPR
jgi:hypothetical protein